MVTDLRNVDFVSFHIKPSISDETWNWIKTELGLSVGAGTLTSDGFVSCVDLGFIRASEGSRYNQNLHPTIENKTVPAPGAHGNYYFGMFWRDKQQNIPIAYDSMTEEQLRAITLLFAGDRKMWDIYFDEAPYKVYHVKLTSPITLNYICLDDVDEESVAPAHIIHNHELGDSAEDAGAPQSYGRLYKGEGSIQIQAFTPFARERYKTLAEYNETNKNEWDTASRIKESLNGYDTFNNQGSCKIWNAGDLDADWSLILPISALTNQNGISIEHYFINEVNPIEDEDGSAHILRIRQGEVIGDDTHIRLSSALNLIEGGTYSDNIFTPSGNVYDKYRFAGKYFKFNRGESRLSVSQSNNAIIEYHYKYY